MGGLLILCPKTLFKHIFYAISSKSGNLQAPMASLCISLLSLVDPYSPLYEPGHTRGTCYCVSPMSRLLLAPLWALVGQGCP